MKAPWAWAADAIGGTALQAGVQQTVAATKRTLALQTCLERALIEAVAAQGVADPSGVADSLIGLVWESHHGTAGVLESLDTNAGAGPLERLTVAARERLGRLDTLTDPFGETQAAALGLDTELLALDFVGFFRRRLNEPGAPQEIVNLALMLELSAVQRDTQTLLSIASAEQVAHAPPWRIGFDARSPLPRDVAALVDADAVPEHLEVVWPPYTSALRRLLELQEPDLRQQLLEIPGAIRRHPDGTPDEVELRDSVHQHALRMGLALDLTTAVTRRLRDLPRRCSAADREHRQLVVHQFLTIANLKLVSLLGLSQLEPNAIRSATFPLAPWPDILTVEGVRPLLGVEENAEHPSGSAMHSVDVEVHVGDHSSSEVLDLRICAPAYAARSTTRGLYPGFVWAWAVPQIELELASRSALARGPAVHPRQSYDAATFLGVMAREPVTGGEDDEDDLLMPVAEDPRLLAITSEARVSGRA